MVWYGMVWYGMAYREARQGSLTVLASRVGAANSSRRVSGILISGIHLREVPPETLFVKVPPEFARTHPYIPVSL